MGAPFGDYILTSYAVACERGEVSLRARRPFEGEPRETEILFSGVVAYDFEHDNFGTILGHIIELSLDEFVRANAEKFAEGWHLSGWARFWTGDVDETVRTLRARDVHAFEISSSYGMRGWVLATSFETRVSPEDRCV